MKRRARTHGRIYPVRYASERLRGKAERIRAIAAMRRGLEPEPRYATGKFWND